MHQSWKGWGDIGFSGSYVTGNFLRLPEGPLCTTINILAISLPSFFTSSVSSYVKLATSWSTLATHLPSHNVWMACSHSLIPDTHISSPWHRPSTSELAQLHLVLSQSKQRSELCRSLAGGSQRIPIPYFIRSSSFRSYLSPICFLSCLRFKII